jgi:hypothetical protein
LGTPAFAHIGTEPINPPLQVGAAVACVNVLRRPLARRPTKSGETIEAGGLKLTERATIDLGLLDLLHRPYRERTINRDTLYTFKAGQPVFTLEATDGSLDTSLSYNDLGMLGAKLKLPSGWRYSSMIIEKDLVLGAAGTATVIQDELENTYQKVD